jgi:hypothetical protein
MNSTYVRTDLEFFNGRPLDNPMARMIGMVLCTERESLRLHEAISRCPCHRSVRRVLRQVMAEKRRQISGLERAMALCGMHYKKERMVGGASITKKLPLAQPAARFPLVPQPPGGII